MVTTEHCPKCGSSLLTNRRHVWCSFVGGRNEKACDYGCSGDVPYLTPRHLETLKLMAVGETTKGISGKLGCGIKTVQKHRQEVLYRFATNCTTVAVIRALKSGVLQLAEL